MHCYKIARMPVTRQFSKLTEELSKLPGIDCRERIIAPSTASSIETIDFSLTLLDDNIEVNMEVFEDNAAIFAGSGAENRVNEDVNRSVSLPNNNIQENRKIKLPIYNPSSTSNWFMMVETVLNKHKIRDQLSKALEVLAVLPVETQDQVAPLIAENAWNVYEQIKDKVTEYNRPSYRERMRDIIKTVPMGNRKPTEYLFFLRKKFGVPQGTSELLEYTFKDGLGENITLALAALDLGDIAEYARKADELFDLTKNRGSSSVALLRDSDNTSQKRERDAMTEANATLVSRVIELERDLAAVKLINEGEKKAYNKPIERRDDYYSVRPKENQRFGNNWRERNYNVERRDDRDNKYDSNERFKESRKNYETGRYAESNERTSRYDERGNYNKLNYGNNKQENNGRYQSPEGPKCWCHLHRRYGASSRGCKNPCSYPKIVNNNYNKNNMHLN